MATLGKAIGVLAREHAKQAEILNHYAEDLYNFGAPSECYSKVYKDYKPTFVRKMRQARRHALHIAGSRNMKHFKKALLKVSPKISKLLYEKYGMII